MCEKERLQFSELRVNIFSGFGSWEFTPPEFRFGF